MPSDCTANTIILAMRKLCAFKGVINVLKWQGVICMADSAPADPRPGSFTPLLPHTTAIALLANPQAMAKLPELQTAMNAYFEAHVSEAGTGLEVLPGVVPMLKALQVHISSLRPHIYALAPKELGHRAFIHQP